MPRSVSFGKVGVNLVAASEAESAAIPDPGTPFRVLIIGDFSGRSNRGLTEVGAKLAARRPVSIDRDNLDEVIAGHNVQLSLGRIGPEQLPVNLKFKTLDDFHPDQTYQQLEIFGALRQTRKRLENPVTFADAAATVRSWAKIEPRPAGATKSEPEPNPLSVENLFDQTVLETQGRDRVRRAEQGGVDWDAMLREIVEPYSIAGADPQLPELLACVDSASAQIMRTILHHRDFQCIEAAWRAAYFLIRHVETDAKLKLYILDLSKAELAADLGATEDLSASGIYKVLVDQTVGTPGANPWAMVVGNYTFDANRDDAELLGRMSKIARLAVAPFVAGAGCGLLGCRSLAETPDPDDWKLVADSDAAAAFDSVRNLPEACYVGLVAPRFLLRLPYGRKTDPTERFAFEEMPGEPDHESYLWGNPATLCACLVAQAFRLQGWPLRPGTVHEVDGMPVHIYAKDGESQVKPCSEAVLSMRAIDKIASLGLMPLAGIQGRDVVRLCSFQSISSPPRPLQGRWHDES